MCRQEGPKIGFCCENGICDPCDMLHGIHDDEPDPPHPYCLCLIFEIDPEFEWEMNIDSLENFNGTWNWEISIDIDCLATGESFHHGPMFFTMNLDDGITPDDHILDAVESWAEDYANEDCGGCIMDWCL